MKKSVAELVERAHKGDQEAIAELYEQTYSSVYQSVRAVMKDEDEALDIVQDSYIKGFQNLDKLGDPEKYQAWMKRLASNMAIDYLRKKRPALFTERIDEDGEEIDLRHQDDCLEHMPEEVIDRQETTRLMNDILATLSQEQRMAVVMYYYEEMSVREIAHELGCSENTVKSRLKYARSKIEVEVRKLEKKGTKLYSLAPMPFFTWLLRMAKEQGISFVLDGLDAVMATGIATAGEATATTGAATATGEVAATTAGSTASGNAVAGAAVKTAGSTAGKTVATKVVAGALAVTMAAGAGAVAVNNINREKENEAAHVIYEEFLERYQDAFELDGASFRLEYDRFWSEIGEDILEQNPNIDLSKTNDWYLSYTSGEDFDNGILLPDTVYEPNMSGLFLLETQLEDEDIRFAYHDINDDGIDEMFIAKFYRGDLQENEIAVYAVEKGKVLRGKVHCMFDGELHTWGFTDSEIAEYVDPGVVYIRMGAGYYDNMPNIGKPNCEWQLLYRAEGKEKTDIIELGAAETTEAITTEDAALVIIEALPGTYRYEVDMKDLLEIPGGREYMIFHNFTITVTDDEIIIEDIGEAEKSIDNRNTFIQDMQAEGYTIQPEEMAYLSYDNWGILRIDRASIEFTEPNILTFDEVGFEGPTAPMGKVNAIDFGRERILLTYYGMAPHEALYVYHKDADRGWYDSACFGGLCFSNNETFPPK